MAGVSRLYRDKIDFIAVVQFGMQGQPPPLMYKVICVMWVPGRGQ